MYPFAVKWVEGVKDTEDFAPLRTAVKTCKAGHHFIYVFHDRGLLW